MKFELIKNIHKIDIKARQEETSENEMEINLDFIRYKIDPCYISEKTLKNKRVSPEEEYISSRLPPSCHSKLVTNEYYLTVTSNYRTNCKCCEKMPSISVPL